MATNDQVIDLFLEMLDGADRPGDVPGVVGAAFDLDAAAVWQHVCDRLDTADTRTDQLMELIDAVCDVSCAPTSLLNSVVGYLTRCATGPIDSESSFVLEDVAQHPHVDTELLVRISELDVDRPDGLWRRLVQNQATPISVCERIAQSSSRTQVLTQLATRRDLTPVIEAVLVADESDDVHMVLARNPAASAATIERFADSHRIPLRRMAASHAKISNATLGTLTGDSSLEVVGAAWTALNDRGCVQLTTL
jgi:hypothetical protein